MGGEHTWTARHVVGMISCPVSIENVAAHCGRTVESLDGVDEVRYGDWVMTRNGSLKGLAAARADGGRKRIDLGRPADNTNGGAR